MRDRILTTQQAAEAFCVPVRTIETWRMRGLEHAGVPGLFRESDVAEMELATRRRPRLVRLVELAQTD